MANNTTLIGLVQADIDALDGTQTLAYLLELKIAAVKLGMSTTSIDTRLDALDMSVADTATLMENAVANELALPIAPNALVRLAPDLDFPASGATYKIITGINASAGLTTAISLTGKFCITLLRLDAVAAENVTIKLTIDGVVIWDASFVSSNSTQNLLNGLAAGIPQEAIQCNSSLLLEVQMATDTSISLIYLARPIL